MSDLKFTSSDVTSLLPENMCGLLKKSYRKICAGWLLKILSSGLLQSSSLSSSSSFLLLHKTVADSRHFMLSEKNFIVFDLNSGEILFLVSFVQTKKWFFCGRNNIKQILLSKNTFHGWLRIPIVVLTPVEETPNETYCENLVILECIHPSLFLSILPCKVSISYSEFFF